MYQTVTGSEKIPSCCPQGAHSAKNTYSPTKATEMGKRWGGGNWMCRDEEMLSHGQGQ